MTWQFVVAGIAVGRRRLQVGGRVAPLQARHHAGEALRLDVPRQRVDPNGNSWLGVSGAYVVFTAATLAAVRLRDNVRIASVARVD
ncbi:MAG: hypothetical protein JOY72_13060 [Actinobacteria bacterium]|nr:hypothetical protein [Actinomycetota bacterium]MBV8481221.1 hypothetical protein [Actinomycetota bacterium]